MGSLDTGSILDISSNPPRQAPSAKLPYYDLKVHELESPATVSSSYPKFHHEKCQDFPIDSSVSAIVQGFATFVSAVTDLPDFSFATITQQQEYVTVASGPSPDKPRTFSSNDTTVSLHEASAHGLMNENESDFELRIPTGASANFAAGAEDDHRQRPLTLSVERTGNSNGTSTATLTLSFNLQYGPPKVAKHLLDLAALYLSPSDELNHELPIPKSQWSCINASPQVLPPMIKPDADTKRAASEQPRHSALLHSAFERRAAESPGSIAIEAIINNDYNVKKWTYGELNAQADALAHELSLAQRELPGWVPAYKNQRAVALFLPGSPEFYIGVCGILKAGLAYCPLPMDAPPQRLLDIAHDSQTSVVLGLGSTPFPGVDLSDDTLETTRALKALLWVDMNDISGWRAGRLSSGALPNGDSAPTQRPAPEEDDLAYILYTSGSTGKPKGVLISHLMATCAVEGNAAACAPMPEYQAMRWLQFGLPTFDMATLEIFLTLSHGGTLCSADRQLTLSNIERVISFFKATGLFTVPSLATVLRPQDLPTLTHIICAGEALTRHVINNFSYDCAQKDGVQTKKLINIYGPSEAAMGITGEVPRAGSRGSIAGEPFACASVFLVDVNVPGELKQVPLGLTGEIVVGGPMVGYGYLNRPIETAKAFGSDPLFGSIYRTGDKGRVVWDVDGTPKMEILGRFNMEQVKLNTRRVELGDIESTIATVDAIREIAVVVVNGIFLVAYFVLHDSFAHVGSNEAVIQTARSTAEAGLPAWMRPAEYVIVPKLPRSFGGKVDRKTLQNIALEQFGASTAQPEFATAGDGDAADDVPVDLTDLESIRAKLLFTYKRVTGDLAEDFDPSIPLTTAGLDSLRTMKFLQELRKSSVGWLAYRDIMAGNSLNDLAQLVFDANKAEAAELAAAKQDDSDEIVQIEDEEELLTLPLAVKLKHFAALTRPQCIEALSIPSEDIIDVLPATGLQTRMWVNFEECRELGVNKPWVEHFAFSVPSHINGDRLEEAVIKSMELRDAFRTVWVQVDHPLSPYAQCILREGSSHSALPVMRVKISSYSERPRSAWQQAIRSAQETAEDIFGLHKLPSVTTFITSDDGKHRVVILSMLHLIYDGISLELLRNNIAEAYHGIPFTGISEKGVLVPVEEHFSSDWLGNSMYWMQRLAGASNFKAGDRVLDSAGFDFVTVNAGLGSASETLLSKYSMGGLFAAAKEKDLFTPTTIVQAAWSMALAKVSAHSGDGGVDVQFSSVFHGRHRPETMDAFAMTLTGLPTQISLSKDPKSNREICKHIFTQYTESLVYSEIPCPSIHFAKSTRRFDSSVILHAFQETDGDIDMNGLPRFSRVNDGILSWRETNAGYPLLLEVWPGKDSVNDALHLRLTYSQIWPGYEYLTPAWIQGTLVAFHQSIISIIETPDELFSL